MFFSAKQRVQSNYRSEIEDATYVVTYYFSLFNNCTSITTAKLKFATIFCDLNAVFMKYVVGMNHQF